MKFDINVWHKYRNKARIIGDYMKSHKDEYGYIIMKKDDFKDCIDKITAILKECSEYMDKCGLYTPPALWQFSINDVGSHASNPAFKHKDKMSKKAIKQYKESKIIKFMTAQ